jgi:hypothetical protein
MKRRFASTLYMLVALAAILTGAASSSVAQSPSSTKAGVCPEGYSSTESGKPLNDGVAIYDDMALYTDYDLDDTVETTVKFKTRLFTYGDTAAKRVFVRVEGKNVCGWANQNQIITSNRPITVSEYDAACEGTARSQRNKEANPLFEKALIKSTPRRAAEMNALFNPKLTPIFRRPLPPGTDQQTFARMKLTDARVFGVYFVFKCVTFPTSGGSEGVRRWLYIGGTDGFSIPPLSGWVDAEDVYRWSTQISVFYNLETDAPFDVYYDLDGAREQDKQKLIAQRPPKAELLIPADRNFPRYPVLSVGSQAERPLSQDNAIRAMKIAYIGQSCIDGGKCTQATQAETQLSRYAEIVANAKNMDVLLVIDNTESMKDYYQPIAKAVVKASENIAAARSGKDGVVRFGGAAYGDYVDDSHTPEQMQFRLFRIQTNTSALNGLAAEPTFRPDPMGDKPEAAFAGLIRAVREANWGSEAGQRVVIWIGDHGNRKKGDRETVDATDVRKIFRDNRVTLVVPINVAGDYNPKFNNLFMDDANELTQQSIPEDQRQIVGIPVIDTHNGGRLKDDAPAAAGRVQQAIEKIFNDSQKLDLYFQCLRRGGCDGTIAGSTKSAREASPVSELAPSSKETQGGVDDAFPTMTIYRGALHAYDLSFEDAKALYSSQTLVTDGWLRYKVGDNSFKYWITVPKANLAILSFTSGQLCQALREGDVEQPMRSALLQAASAVSGDPLRPGEEISAFLERILHFPKENFSKLFDVNLEDFGAWWREVDKNGRKGSTYQDRVDFRYRVCKSVKLFQTVYEKQLLNPDTDLEKGESATGEWRLKKDVRPRVYQWLWRLENGFEVYYLPSSYLPGGGK